MKLCLSFSIYEFHFGIYKFMKFMALHFNEFWYKRCNKFILFVLYKSIQLGYWDLDEISSYFFFYFNFVCYLLYLMIDIHKCMTYSFNLILIYIFINQIINKIVTYIDNILLYFIKNEIL